jgi:ribose 5-phosphate isomerase RpiB
MLVVALGADHAGFALKETLKAWLVGRGYTVLDFGTHGTDPVDYPDYAAPVGVAVGQRVAACGVLVCGSGIGTTVATSVLESWLATSFEGGRHATRIDKVAALERRSGPAGRGSAIPDEVTHVPAR